MTREYEDNKRNRRKKVKVHGKVREYSLKEKEKGIYDKREKYKRKRLGMSGYNKRKMLRSE